MSIAAGTKLGPYEITGAIGAGGMGEVYRARDPKLGRDVAIKVLPEAFARDTERMARFQREAKVLASLDHPNIASIYGLEDSGGTYALVMQLVEGPTLADRIKAGPIPIDESVRIARQIADALEYAHERGIIHRDLKPANVKVTNDEAVKVLDFGLAKALEGDPSSIDISTSPTISRMATQAGVLLGTAAYMSPEQAKAKTVDRRADIWAFGCVMYEMLTGKQAFPGETVTESLAAVIRAEPDWSQLPANTPMRVRVLLQRCLQKDPKQRLRDIGDARISIDEVLSGAPDLAPVGGAEPAAVPLWRRALPWALFGVMTAFALALAFVHFRERPTAGPVTRFEISEPDNTILTPLFAISPDGHNFAFVAPAANGRGAAVWVRSLETLNARPLDGTEGAGNTPFWSPDSRFIAFYAQGKLKKIEAVGAPPLTLCDADNVYGGVWTRDDKIIFGSSDGLRQVSASGGSPSPVTTNGAAATPSLLPDGRHFVYLHGRDQGRGVGIYVGSLGMKPDEQSSKKLLADNSNVVYAPSSDPAFGYLLFVRGALTPSAPGTLMAQPFDARRLELAGEAVPIAERVPGIGFSASDTNVLVYGTGFGAGGAPGDVWGQLAWFDRSGKVLEAFGDPAVYRGLALSPDGKRVAFERVDPQNSGARNIWLYEFARGVTTRFTFDSRRDLHPVWSPDGSRIVFGSDSRSGAVDLYQKASNLAGEDERLYKSNDNKAPSSWSPDGRFLLFFNFNNAPSQIWLLPFGGGGGDRKAIPLERSQFNQQFGRFSPDGRWIAYESDESGRWELYVRPFDASAATGSPAAGAAATGKWMVSKGGGRNPRWSHDGKELLYLSSLGGTMMTVPVNTSSVFQAGIPKPLFKVPAGVYLWDVSPDGKRFIMAAPSAASASVLPPSPKYTVVLNWTSLLKK
jgi:eukaryotic-like serine/threonine-protein kinase